MKKEAHFTIDRRYRYMLVREWDNTKPTICFIGLNPSTANEHEDDPTIRRVITFAKSFGYGKVYMLNLFSFVTSKPKELLRDKDGSVNNHFIKVFTLLSDKVVFCWGNFKTFGRDQEVIKMIPGAHCLGKNANGSPKHPLYLKSNTPLQIF